MKELPLLFEDRAPAVATPAAQRSVTRGLLLVVLIFAATRLVTWTGTYYGAATLLRIEHQLDPPFEKHVQSWRKQPLSPDTRLYRDYVDLLHGFAPLCRFDGVHYRSIIEGGYHYEPPPPDATNRRQLEQNIAFFPLFPLACRPLTGFLSTNAAMVLIAHLGALAAAIVLYLWVRRRVDEPAALFAVAATFCWPAAVYYSYGYAESFTLLLSVIALALMDRRAYWPAAVACGLATATRPTAFPIVLVLALAFWFNRDESPRRKLVKLVPLGLIGAAGIIGYALFLWHEYESPLVYFANFEAGWNPEKNRADWLGYLTLTPVWEQFKYFRDLVRTDPPVGIINLTNTLMWNVPLNLFILFLSLAGLRRVPRSFRPLLALGPLIFLHAYLASGGAKFGVEPIARYTAVAAPAFVVLAAWCTREWRNGWRTALVALMLLLQATWAFRFGMQEWSG